MNIHALREKILHDDDFVLSEVAKLQYCFGLKREIRYGLDRTADDFTESVAEHVYGMHIVADYFLPLVSNEHSLAISKVRQMITWHDVDELETGDVISWQKTEEQVANERTAWQAVVPHIPEHMQTGITDVVGEYEERSTAEARFVKAVDKTEPIFHLYSSKGKAWANEIGLTRHDADRVKQPFVAAFPIMKRFIDVVHDAMEQEGFFRS